MSLCNALRNRDARSQDQFPVLRSLLYLRFQRVALLCLSLGAPKDLSATGKAKVPAVYRHSFPGETSLSLGHTPPPALGSVPKDHQQLELRGAS